LNLAEMERELQLPREPMESPGKQELFEKLSAS
jgi:hypothetical protein